jgi:hypothetical protein
MFAHWNGRGFSGPRSRFAVQMGYQTPVLSDTNDDEAGAAAHILPAFARLSNSFAELGKRIVPRR